MKPKNKNRTPNSAFFSPSKLHTSNFFKIEPKTNIGNIVIPKGNSNHLQMHCLMNSDYKIVTLKMMNRSFSYSQFCYCLRLQTGENNTNLCLFISQLLQTVFQGRMVHWKITKVTEFWLIAWKLKIYYFNSLYSYNTFSTLSI